MGFEIIANDSIPCIFFLCIGALIVACIGLGIWFERKRTAALEAVANELGLPYFPKGDSALVHQLSSFELFSKGRSRKIKNMIHGETANVELGIFDYQYRTGSGKNSRTWKQTVVYIRSAELNLPQFALRPENMFDKIGGFMGFQDIDFDTHPAFSKMYVLRGPSEEQIRGLFQSHVLEHFETASGINVEGGGDQLVYFRASRRAKPAQVKGLMEEGFKVFTLLRRQS